MRAGQLPEPNRAMFAGVVGELVDTFIPVTEASPVAIALQFIVAMGSAVGRGPHFYVGETRHGLNEYVAIVGPTARARKGDAKNIALRPLERADPDWFFNVASGLSSGEGLIYAVRDRKTTEDEDGNEHVLDEGAADKRLLVIETEFSQPLKMFRRDGNILSNILRDAWDGKASLRTLTRRDPLWATDTHISIIAHTTPDDLRAHLSDLEVANGLGNRFLFAVADRAKLLANPGRVPPEVLTRLGDKVAAVLNFAGGVGEIRRTPEAAELWERIYPSLTADRPGLLGELLARAEAHVARLSTLFTLLTQARETDVKNIQSALAVWDYCVASAELIFHDRTGNDVADRIKAEMLPGDRLTLNVIRKQVFANHVRADRLEDALELLERLGEVKLENRETGGRSATDVLRLDRAKEGNDQLRDLEVSQPSSTQGLA